MIACRPLRAEKQLVDLIGRGGHDDAGTKLPVRLNANANIAQQLLGVGLSPEGLFNEFMNRKCPIWPLLEKEAKAALFEGDAVKRGAMYQEIQKKFLDASPFIILYQQTEVAGYRKDLKDFKLGPSFDNNFVWPISK